MEILGEEPEFQITAKSAGLIGLTAMGGALVGFVLQLLVAYFFGASGSTDAYFMAQSTSEMLSKLLLGGSITAVFIPMFVERLALGRKQDAWRLALNVAHLTAGIFVLLVILIGIFAQPFVHFIAPGFDAATAATTVQLLRVLLPSFLILFLVELATSMLQAMKQFTIPAFLRLVAPATSIIVILLIVRTLGIYALATGAVIGSLVQLALVAWGLRRQGLHYEFVFAPLDPAVKRLIHLTYPFLFSVMATQAAGIVYRILVSDLESGSLAALKFAEKITQLATIIFLNSVTFVIYPLLSAKASQKDFTGMRATIASAVRLVTFVTLPLMIGIVILREPLVGLVYQRGSFSAHDAQMTSLALLFLVIGLTANGISSILGHATLALQKTRAAVAVSIASQVVAISLFFGLVPRLGLAGLALGSSLVPLAIASLYFIYLRRFIPKLGQIFWHQTFIKIGALALVLAVVVAFTLARIGQMQTLLQLLVPTFFGCLVYFGGAYMWSIPEMRQVMQLVWTKLKRASI